MSTKNPYTPGYGLRPPVFAGRERELQLIDDLTNRLADQARVSQDIILYGPRGNGKTSLLQRVAERLTEDSIVRTIKVLASDVPDARELHSTILVRSIPAQATKTSKLGGKIGIGGTGTNLGRETSEVFKSSLRELRELCLYEMKARPTLLMVDEAHLVSQETLNSILSLANAARDGNTNFAFVLAGTPGLPSHIRNSGASYLSRAQHMRLERLDFASAKTALLLPLEEANYDISLSEVEESQLIELTQCYPHFIQCVGHAIWDAVEESEGRIVDTGVLSTASQEWTRSINAMYADRMRELERADLIKVAVALAKAFEDSHLGKLSIEKIKKTISKSCAGTNIRDATEELEGLGFVWESEGGDLLFEPGIPSLMAHVLRADRMRDQLDSDHK